MEIRRRCLTFVSATRPGTFQFLSLTSADRILRMKLAMDSLVSTFHNAAISPEAWPEALKALTEAVGVAGAALIISNKRTGNVDAAYFSGLSAGFKSDYIRHHAALEPYSPLL